MNNKIRFNDTIGKYYISEFTVNKVKRKPSYQSQKIDTKVESYSVSTLKKPVYVGLSYMNICIRRIVDR